MQKIFLYCLMLFFLQPVTQYNRQKYKYGTTQWHIRKISCWYDISDSLGSIGLQNLPRVMASKDGCQERVKEICSINTH